MLPGSCSPGNQTPLVEFPLETQMFQYTIPATCLCLSVNAAPACILHPATICWIASGAPLPTLQLGSYLFWDSLYGSGALGLFMCYDDQSLCAVLQASLFVATGSHFLCQWYILCKGQVVHDVCSLCSSSVFSLGLGNMA